MPLAFNYRLDSTIDKAFLDTTMDKAFQKNSFTSTQPSTNLFDVKIFVHLDSTIDISKFSFTSTQPSSKILFTSTQSSPELSM